MNKLVYTSDIQRLQTGLTKIGIPLATKPTTAANCTISCYLYRNPDGSIRWLWPIWSDQPDFLRFYHAGSRQARWFVWLVRLLFRLKRGHWMGHDRITFYTTEAGYQLLRRTQVNRWALFTGTAGPNRKLVIWYNTQVEKGFFLKVALAEPAVINLRQEALALRQLQQNPLLQLATPQLEAYSESMLIQEDMGDADTWQINKLAELPYGAMQEFVSQNWHTKPLQQADFWTSALDALVKLRVANDSRIPVSLLDKLERLIQSLDEQAPIAVASAHGDFTPWNILLRGHKLCVIDWELYRAELPGLYDLFHFQYQSMVMLGNQGFNAIRREVDTILKQTDWRLFRERNSVDVDLAEKLYLIHTITYYLSVYSRQPDWHQQVNWLLDTWNQALTYWLGQKQVVSDRKLVLHDLAFWLHKQPHAALKFLPTYLDALPDSSDLDLAMPRQTAKQLVRYVRQHPLIRQVTVDHRSFMKQLHIQCLDNTSLHVDLIWTFKRKHLEFMDAHAVWEQATLAPHGLNVPTLACNQTYVRRFYGLNNALIPARYRHLFDEPVIGSLLAESVTDIRAMPQNRGWRAVRSRLAYGLDTLRSFAFQRGMIVTFSGVDGAGKSTVIEQTKLEIEKKLRQRVIVLRHRPSLLPILSAWQYGRREAEQRSTNRLPRQGTNQSGLSSLLRFAYYYADYLLGQFYVQVKYVWRGYIVLYDRYYFDFINDSRRSNVQLPSGLAAGLYRFLMKPQLNVFLYAPAEDILRRKQELDAETIADLTRQYLGLFDSLQKQYPSSEYMPVLNQDLPVTLTRIFDRIQRTTVGTLVG
ncbi:phosphotransferase [Fibrella forsythiae]|uniref:Phosphotransferase n=1 Tax=Fibrella forsythiae TaxID=2817061 RepID=A0ABS3JI01_9BACT|nr:phosphotransferase [Fibrella forsythiae]MBO0949644.1 phosphotransferase [Fibrella forsythiae]